MSVVIPIAKKKDIPVVCYNMSLGPISSKLGKVCIKRVLDCTELVIVRDKESIRMLQDLNINVDNIKMAADSAWNIFVLNPFRLPKSEHVRTIINENDRYMSFNVTSYIDTWLSRGAKGFNADNFVRIMADAIIKSINAFDVKILLVVTQIMDLEISKQIYTRVNHPSRVAIVSNKEFNFHEIIGFISKAELHIGMRTHSLIFAAASCVPTIGIITYPKNRGFMESIEQEERMIGLDNSFNVDTLFRLILKTWDARKTIRKELRPVAAKEKNKASSSAKHLRKYLN
jgi:polysaccharide pyruvyl transferase WcaK-like protein